MMASPHSSDVPRSMLSYALEHSQTHAFRVFPLAGGRKTPVIPEADGGHGCLDATTDEAQIRTWWSNYPRANIGIAAGDGLLLIDEDIYKGADLSDWHLPPTRTARSARGGQHRYFSYPGILPCVSEGKLAPGICIKGQGGYVVAPGSVVDGKRYEWLDEHQPITPLPERIAEMIRNATARPETTERPHTARPFSPGDATKWIDEAVAKVRGGMTRNDVGGKWLAQQLRDNEVADPEGAMLAYAAAVRTMGDHEYTDAEALRTIRHIMGTPKRERARAQVARERPAEQRETPRETFRVIRGSGGESGEQDKPTQEVRTWHLTDTGNAERLVARHGDKLRYCAKFKSWLVWDGARWKPDETDTVMLRVKSTVRSILGEAEHEEDDKRRQQLAKWAITSESAKSRNAMEQLARPELPITPDELDADPWLLNVANGTIDLRTGHLRPPHRGDYITKSAPVPYDPAAKCPTFLAWLREILNGDEQLVTFLQRYIGYALTGSTREHKFVVLHGTGRNGKSTLLELLRDLLGDYAMQTPAETLMARETGAIPNDIARLKGARFVSAVETEEGRRLGESLVKQMTGGDMLTARFMRAEWFEFRPVFKVFLATNHKPNIRGTDNAIWARIRLVPFRVSFLGREDTTLPDRLREELPGILAWAVQGCLDWQRDGLTEPPEVVNATQEYRAEMDTLADFLADACELHPTATITSKRLRDAYEQWCDKNGEHPIGSKTFSQRLASRDGIKRTTGLGGKASERGWAGLRLKIAPDGPDSSDSSDTESGITLTRNGTSLFTGVEVSASVKCQQAKTEATEPPQAEMRRTDPVAPCTNKPTDYRSRIRAWAQAHNWRELKVSPHTYGGDQALWETLLSGGSADDFGRVLAAISPKGGA